MKIQQSKEYRNVQKELKATQKEREWHQGQITSLENSPNEFDQENIKLHKEKINELLAKEAELSKQLHNFF